MKKPSLTAPAQAAVAFSVPATTYSNIANPTVVCEGWVLKKRRKKMQGFARRYFVLYHTGLLQYSFEPGQPVRDQLSVQHAAISTTPGRKDIHIDSGTATFHIKCLNTGDFNVWMGAFRTFITLGQETKRSASIQRAARQASISLSKSEDIVERMTAAVEQVEESVLSLLQEFPAQKHPSLGKKVEKDKHKDHAKDAVFNLFKRQSHQPASEFGADTSLDVSPSVQRVLTALHQLKSQHAILLKSMQLRIANDLPSVYRPPLSRTTEESEDRIPRERISEAPCRQSISTTVSDGTYEWFDAVDNVGPEEFVMDTQVSLEAIEQSSRMPTNDSRSSLGHSEHSSNDTDIEGGNQVERVSEELKQPVQTVIRRTLLPCPAVGDEGSLFAILKKNVGKDLSTITFPVTFNEPLTLLQRAAEEVEYFDLLDEAVRASSPVDQLSYVAAFAVSGYAHTRHRSGRKGFNPMLAETFEDIRMKFIAEKVRHNPLEMAYHAEGNGWELTATSAGKTKFWGKSLEIIPQGVTRLRIAGDNFIWTKPSSFIRNLMVGTKYLEHCGNLIVENTTQKYRCVLEFKQNGYWGPLNVVSGPIYSPSGQIVSHIEGKWDDQDAHNYFGFTAFGITLNEVTPNLTGKIPPTDSRYRPDVRALENGDPDTAEDAKLKIEEAQRERRRSGQEREPRWFRLIGNEWVYAGGYWEARARGWKDENIQPLW